MNTSENPRLKLGIILPEAEFDIEGETPHWWNYEANGSPGETDRVGLGVVLATTCSTGNREPSSSSKASGNAGPCSLASPR